ncbi:hypothetical protein IU501_35605 [Nocardia otitidiscaviarum]|uniref:hypothetical protein n=1 Tax=Nocardia otitidiscaviarum TaxID=1823 RepID=UPI0004A6F125|nr:hypothetical protein [Nocardia otitidiscaviarum]MBF6138302.1 hypothetical protein [Nocardia otitidiscaviarum]MBF6489059.1 hypothetical protein [Nocardia otitidiscaviarum]
MRIRVISLGFVAAAGGAAAVLVGSGTASAVTPFVGPDEVGVVLTPGETAAFAAGPIPGGIDALVPFGAQRVDLEPESQLAEPDGSTYASTAAIAAEAAAHPGGGAYVSVVNPLDPRDPGALLVVGQYW